MKYLKTAYMAISMLGAVALGSCQADMDNPGLKDPQASIKANTTIAELKETFWKDNNTRNYAILCPQKEDGTDYIIKGRVVSSDASGNIYKGLYIQDETAAITLSIDQNSLYNQYRIGQEVVLDVTGLYIGKYAGLEQIGGYGEYNGTPQVSFMTYESFKDHVQLNGLPTTKMQYIGFGDPLPTNGDPYCIKATISQINGCTSDAEIRAMQSQLVELQNVKFEQGGTETFAPYQENANRNLTDASGQTIIVRNSGYATFYNKTLPEGTGNVRGMLGYFNGSWQIVLRSYADCIFDSKGTENEPYSVEEAIGLQETGASGWVKGFIVGSVKAGVTTITSADQIDWTASDPTDNNLVIGATADTKAIDQVIILPLQQDSPLRKYGNLADNPKNLGKAIKASGTFAKVLGIAGLTGNTGLASEFKIDGVSVGGDEPNPGTGTTVYTGLVNDANDWKFENTDKPENLKDIWSWMTYENSGYLNATAFANNTAYQAEAWAISPVITLTGYKGASVDFDHASKYQTTLRQLCGIAVREVGTTAWTMLNVPVWPAAGSWTFVNSGAIDLSAYAGKKIELAFKYGSNAQGADKWEIKNFKVTGTK